MLHDQKKTLIKRTVIFLFAQRWKTFTNRMHCIVQDELILPLVYNKKASWVQWFLVLAQITLLAGKQYTRICFWKHFMQEILLGNVLMVSLLTSDHHYFTLTFDLWWWTACLSVWETETDSDVSLCNATFASIWVAGSRDNGGKFGTGHFSHTTHTEMIQKRLKMAKYPFKGRFLKNL